MWRCFPFCRPSHWSKEKDEVLEVSPSAPQSVKSEPEESGGSFVLTDFSRDLERRKVDFVPPAPALPRCSLCGFVPPRLFASESCAHEFCSRCLDSAQPHCPFDGSTWGPAKTNTDALELISKASVFCWNRSNGCSYVGCVLDMPWHYQKCPYYVTHCGLCDEEIRMKDLITHARRSCNAAGEQAAEDKQMTARGTLKPGGSLPRTHLDHTAWHHLPDR